MGLKGTRSAQTTFILIHCFLRLYGFDSLKEHPPLLSDFYTASPSLRVSIKQQCCCLWSTSLYFTSLKQFRCTQRSNSFQMNLSLTLRLILLFEMTKGTYALRNDIYAATPFLRINFKEQSCCLWSNLVALNCSSSFLTNLSLTFGSF